MEQYNKIESDSVNVDINVKLDLNDKDFDNKSKQRLFVGDVRDLGKFNNDHFDLILLKKVKRILMRNLIF